MFIQNIFLLCDMYSVNINFNSTALVGLVSYCGSFLLEFYLMLPGNPQWRQFSLLTS